MPTLKALGGRGVWPVPEPEISRKAVDATGEVLRGGCVAEVDGGAARVFSMEAETVLLGFLAADVVREHMLRKARKGAGGEKSRGGHIEPAVKEGCPAISVLVTHGIIAAILYSCNFPGTGAFR